MKKFIILLTISTLSTSAMAEETSWFDSLKSFVGLSETKEQAVEMPSTDGLVELLTSSLNVDTAQASGGMGAIFNYVKTMFQLINLVNLLNHYQVLMDSFVKCQM